MTFATFAAAQVLRVVPRVRLSQAVGRLCDANVPAPLSRWAASLYCRAYRVNLDEAEPAHGGYSSFDQFFTRRLRSGVRPIADASVSRRHAELSPVEGGKLFVTDCNSSNGTYLVRNGATTRITQDTALPGDSLKFGDVTIDVGALLEAMAARAAVSKPAPAVAAAAPAGAAEGRRVRCDCGAVKTAGSRCPECGA